MRIPVSGNISTKDGSSNKNARMTNMLAEEKQGKSFAAIRPGLSQVATGSGDGNNLVCFNGNLINIYGNTVYQAVLSGGVGEEYSYNYLPIPDRWNHVIWNGSKFCAVGYTYSATSEDGLTWDYGNMPFVAWWRSVAWNGTIFCAVMKSSFVSPYIHAGAISEDGINWTAVELPTNDEEDENGNSDIASNGTLFVTVSYDNIGNFYTSTNGIDWTARTAPSPFGGYGGYIGYGDGKFVAACKALGTVYTTTSTDGITWTAASTPSISLAANDSLACKITYTNDNFVLPVGGSFQYSSDGASWSSFTYSDEYIPMSVIWDGEKYVVPGYEWLVSGVDVSDYPWEFSTSSYPEYWMTCASNGTNIVIMGHGTGYSDTDSYLIDIADPTYTLESIGTMTDGYFDFALIP